MEFLTKKKDDLKCRVNKIFQCYGHLCATNPLPMIISSVVIVLICSLPLLSHPVFERTATFLFGRIQLEKYKTNISVSSIENRDQSTIIVQQVNMELNVTIEKTERNAGFGKWIAFQNALDMAGVRNVSRFCKTREYFNWTSSCLRVSRKPFYKSPQTRLIYPRGRFHKELRLLFPKSGCLSVSPAPLCSTEERQFMDFPVQFKELLLGYPLSETGLLNDEVQDGTHQFHLTISFFMRKYDERLSTLLKQYFESRGNATVLPSPSLTYRVSYLPTEEDDHMELIILSVTYLLVFFYILFSVGKINTLKSRWGLAFSAVMTIIMSMIMALGLCASLDLLPTILTITEIFPYIVIVIGLENVMIITKSVMSAPDDLDVAAKVAKGMGKEGWYITKNLLAELTILGAGYHTLIPSLQEFCAFAYVGVLSDFFIQMVFFAPVLAVDVRRAEICHLEQITIGQQFAVGFNLMQKTALTLVPPSPQSLRSKYLKRMRKRFVQKLLTIVFAFYIIYAVYNNLQDNKSATVSSTQTNSSSDGNAMDDVVVMPTSYLHEKSDQDTKPNIPKDQTNLTSADGSPSNVTDFNHAVGGGVASWEYLSKQHWPELLTFYHIPFNERSLLILPDITVAMNITMNDTASDLTMKFTGESKMEEFLLVAAMVVCALCSLTIIWILFLCLSKKRGQMSVLSTAGSCHTTSVFYSGHKHCIDSLHADKPHVVSVSLAGSVKIWDTRTSECVMDMSRNKRRPGSKECSPSPSTVRQRKHPGKRRFSNLADCEPARSVWCLDSKHSLLVVAFSNGAVEVRVISSSRLTAHLQEEEAVVAVKIASRNTILVGRIDGILDIIEVRRNQLDSIGDGEVDDIWQANPDKLDRPVGCRIKHRVRAHIGPIENLMAVSGVVFCSSADVIKVYEIDDANCCSSLSLNGNQIATVHQIKEINGLAMAVGCENGCIMIATTSGRKSIEYTWHTSYIESISSCSKCLASLDSNKKISVWTADGKDLSCIKQGLPHDVYAINFLNSSMLCTLSQDSAWLYDVTDCSLLRRIELQADSCNQTRKDMVCYPDWNSIALAKGASFQLLTFPNLNQLESTDSNR